MSSWIGEILSPTCYRDESLPLWLLERLTKSLYLHPAVVTKYQKHISGPILDRIDIHIEVPRVDYGKPSGHDRVTLKFLVLQICLQTD